MKIGDLTFLFQIGDHKIFKEIQKVSCKENITKSYIPMKILNETVDILYCYIFYFFKRFEMAEVTKWESVPKST